MILIGVFFGVAWGVIILEVELFKFSKRTGDPHIVTIFWIPAFAGMTGDSYFSRIVIPAKAGIQELLP